MDNRVVSKDEWGKKIEGKKMGAKNCLYLFASDVFANKSFFRLHCSSVALLVDCTVFRLHISSAAL